MGSFVFLSGTCTLFCLGAVSSFTAPAPWRLSFSPGPLHRVSLEDSLMMLIHTVARYATVVVLVCLSLSSGEFVHPFHELFLFFFFWRLVIKLTCWNWLLESGPRVEFFWLLSSGRLVTVCVICARCLNVVCPWALILKLLFGKKPTRRQDFFMPNSNYYRKRLVGVVFLSEFVWNVLAQTLISCVSIFFFINLIFVF